MDPAIVGTARADYCRADVYNTVFDNLVKAFEARGSCDVTRRKLTLGARDSVTGWRVKSFTEDTVKAIHIPRSSSELALKVGTYVRTDALEIVCAGFSEGDEVKTPDGKYWEVKATRERWETPESFSYRELDLTLVPLHI